MPDRYTSYPQNLKFGLPDSAFGGPKAASALGSIGSAIGGGLMAANPISFGAAAAPALVQGAFGLLSGLIAPSQKKKWKWEREHLQKLTDQRLANINKSMKPNTPYFNFAQNAPQMTNILNNLLGAKAGMYYGGATGPGWGGNNFSGTIQGMQGGGRAVTPGTLPGWAKSV